MVACARRGLGFAIARELAHEGARVSIAPREAAAADSATRKMHEEYRADALGFGCDVRSLDVITAWLRATIEKFGGLDMLVTNSGEPPARTFDNLDVAA